MLYCTSRITHESNHHVIFDILERIYMAHLQMVSIFAIFPIHCIYMAIEAFWRTDSYPNFYLLNTFEKFEPRRSGNWPNELHLFPMKSAGSKYFPSLKNLLNCELTWEELKFSLSLFRMSWRRCTNKSCKLTSIKMYLPIDT